MPRPLVRAVAALTVAGSPVLFEASESKAYRAVIEQVKRYAKHDAATILLSGESGTGKTMIATLIHKFSSRADRNLVVANLSQVDEHLAGSELFGHEAGAFTGAHRQRAGLFLSAHGGTLFLDEIGKARKATQNRLLRLLDDKSIRHLGADRELRVDVRIIVASNENLEELAKRGQFLPDLLARLGMFRIRVPSLRERREDIGLLARACVFRHATAYGYQTSPPNLDEALLEALERAEWPDNIRQLDSTIQRLLVDADGAEVLTLAHCRDDLSFLRFPDKGRDRRRVVTHELTQQSIMRAGSVSAAARELHVARSTIQRNRDRSSSGSHAADNERLTAAHPPNDHDSEESAAPSLGMRRHPACPEVAD